MADTALARHLQSFLDQAVSQGLPGVSLRVSGPGLEFESASGSAVLQTGERLTPDHAFYIASVGKIFTAVVILQMVAEGRLDLSSPLMKWLPARVSSRIPGSDSITLSHLLSHTSGLMDYMNDEEAWMSDFDRDPGRYWTHADVIPYLYDQPLLFEPGSSYHYSNSNYVLAGYIAEQVTGRPFHEVERARILKPLGLKHTFNGLEKGRYDKRAHGYTERHGRLIDTDPWFSHYGLADSGLYSTPDDLVVFMRALFKDGSLLSEAMLRLMLSPSGKGYPPSNYGLGILVERNPHGMGYRWLEHNGIDPGFHADVIYLPELDLAIALVANAGLGEEDLLYERLLENIVQVVVRRRTSQPSLK